MKENKITRRQYNSKSCFVCGLGNDMGLHTRFYETADNELIAVCTPKSEHQSYPGRLHGGISSALLDETIGRAITIGHAENIWGVTLNLTLKYRKPVPYGVEIKVIGRITNDRGRFFEGTGEIILPDGEVAVSAEGLFMKQSADNIADSTFVEEEWDPADEDIPDVIIT